jgi:hypothetical protein
MAIKMLNLISGKMFFLVGILITLGQPLAFGQDAAETAPNDQRNYYIDHSEGEPRLVQRLIWEKADYVLRYEVTVQKREAEGRYSEAERVSTEENFAEFSLIAGRYRFSVALYDFLDEFSFSTEWREFEIVRAFQPELLGFSPQVFYFDEDAVWELTVHGRNLLPESEIYLVQGNTTIRPASKTCEGDSAHLLFPTASLVLGEFSVYVRNPGGLDALLKTFTITNKKPFDLNISLGYAPIIPLYGYLFRDFALEKNEYSPLDANKVQAPFPDNIYPLGLAARIGLMFYKRNWGNLGLEASGSFTPLKHESELYTSLAYLSNAHLSFMYQKYFFRRAVAFNASLGVGLAVLQNFHYEYADSAPTENKNAYFPSSIASFSFMVFIVKPVFLNVGADFIQTFTSEAPLPGFILPFALVGLRL